MRRARPVAALLALASLLAAPMRAEEVRPDLRNCRGVNYVIAGSHNPIDQWLNYDPAMVEANLDSLGAFGVNALRVFGSFSVWDQEPLRYTNKLHDFAARAFRSDMLLMWVLFDSFGQDPTGDLAADADTRAWFCSPPRSALRSPTSTSRFQQYVRDTLWALEQAAREVGRGQVIYDAWNEPNGSYVPDTVLVDVLRGVKSLGDRPTTVGFARVEENLSLLGVLPDPALLDIVSHHPYGIFEAVIQQEARQARAYAAMGVSVPRPIVATEVVHHGAAQDCAHVLDWLDREGEGFFVWEAFASRTPFAPIDGLFYEDAPVGEVVLVRDLEGVNKLLALAVAQGFQPRKVARLKAPDAPGFVPYSPVPYGFTAPMAHDLLMHWDQRFGTYFPTVVSGDPRALDFHLTLLTWAVLSLGKLGQISTAERATISVYQEDLALARELGDLVGVERAFRNTALLLAPKVVPFAAPRNTPPEIVYLRQRLEPLAARSSEAEGLVGERLTIEMLVNDADRLSDVTAAEVFLWVGEESLPLSLTVRDGFLRGVYPLPRGARGFPYSFLGGVLDQRGALDFATLPDDSTSY